MTVRDPSLCPSASLRFCVPSLWELGAGGGKARRRGAGGRRRRVRAFVHSFVRCYVCVCIVLHDADAMRASSSLSSFRVFVPRDALAED